MNRKTLMKKYRSITETLLTLDRKDLHPYEQTVALESIKRDIAATWVRSIAQGGIEILFAPIVTHSHSFVI